MPKMTSVLTQKESGHGGGGLTGTFRRARAPGSGGEGATGQNENELLPVARIKRARRKRYRDRMRRPWDGANMAGMVSYGKTRSRPR